MGVVRRWASPRDSLFKVFSLALSFCDMTSALCHQNVSAQTALNAAASQSEPHRELSKHRLHCVYVPLSLSLTHSVRVASTAKPLDPSRPKSVYLQQQSPSQVEQGWSRKVRDGQAQSPGAMATTVPSKISTFLLSQPLGWSTLEDL